MGLADVVLPPPAGGADLVQAVGATAAAAVLLGGLLWLGFAHRSGRIRFLGALADRASGLTGVPGWASLPAGLATASLIGALFGMYWDISLHIDNGRDAGPLANPAHYFILAGLFGQFASGWLAMALPKARPGPAAIRIWRDWYAPVSGILLFACGAFALLGFPLDDVWHRLFGQDVTLWGPTHLMLIGGAGVSLVAILGLLVEGRAAPDHGRQAAPGPVRVASSMSISKAMLIAGSGGLVAGLSVFQGEFDFGVPQFRLLYQPVLIAVAAAIALVTTRMLAGRGAAIGAAVFFVVVRGGVALLVGPVLGEVTPHLPLYLVEALLVEAVALVLSPDRPYRFGIVAGALIGSVGVAAEWGWARAWMPVPWPVHLLPQASALALPVGVAGGVLGAFVGSALRGRADVVGRPRAWAAATTSLLVIGAVVAFLLPTRAPEGVRVTATLTDVRSDPHREVRATVRFDPPDVARGADWLTVTAWQGGDRLRLVALSPVEDGVYRTTSPVPVHGTWKSTIRLHRGGVLASVPLYLPADRAIPAAEVPAFPRVERRLVDDRLVLQRERKTGVPGWLWGAAGVVVLAIAVCLVGLLGWGLVRLARFAPVKGVPTAEVPAGAHSGAKVA